MQPISVIVLLLAIANLWPPISTEEEETSSSTEMPDVPFPRRSDRIDPYSRQSSVDPYSRGSYIDPYASDPYSNPAIYSTGQTVQFTREQKNANGPTCQYPSTLSYLAQINSTTDHKSCKDQLVSIQFGISTENDGYYYELPFKNGNICKASLNGVEYLGFTYGLSENRHCSLHIGSDVVEYKGKFAVLLKPSVGEFQWRDSNGIKESFKTAIPLMGDDRGNFSTLGMAYFQTSVGDDTDSDSDTNHNKCQQYTSSKALCECEEDLVSGIFRVFGFVSNSHDPAVMRFQFGGKFYLTQQFKILSCEE